MGDYSPNISKGHRSPLRTVNNNKDLGISSVDGAEDDQAESVDSGCVPDLTPETNWLEISSTLNYEYSFVSSLLLHTSQGKCKNSDTIDTSIPQNKSNSNKILTSSEIQAIIKKKENKELSKKLKMEAIKKENVSDNTENASNSTSLSVFQKKKLERELSKLKRGKFGALTPSQAKTRESKIKKLLNVTVKKNEKRKKKLKQEQNAANIVPSKIKPAKESIKKIYNNNGKLVYSKFDFSGTAKDRWREKSKPDLNYFMSKVIKEKERIKSLEEEGKVDKAVDCIGRKLWNNAMKKAQGEKVRDNNQMLKKSLERKKQQKKKSQEKWAERNNNVKKSQEKRQEKKVQNVASRKQKQQQRSKGKKKKGKGTRVPGF